VRLELSRRQLPEDPQNPFMPMRLPERIRPVLQGPLVRQLHRATLRATLSFRSGTYLLPIAKGPPCEVELLPDTRAFLRLEIAPGAQDIAARSGAEPGAHDVTGPVVRWAELHFTPALRIHNVAQTLGQIHDLAEDRFLSVLRPLRPRLPGWIQELTGLALGSADVAATVLLERVQVQVKPAAVPVLHPSFTGRVRWFDQLELPFHRVRLPGTVLPLVFAELERLLSGRPLATADVVESPGDPWGLLASMQAMLDTVEGEVTAELEAPELVLSTQTIDGVQLSVNLPRGQRIALQGSYEVRAEPDGGPLELASQLRLGTDGEGELRLGLDATVQMDLDPSDRPWGERVTVQVELELQEHSRWPELRLELHSDQPLCKGQSAIPLRLEQLELQGGVGLQHDGARLELLPTRPLSVRGQLRSVAPGSADHRGADLAPGADICVERGGSSLQGALDGALELTVRPDPAGRWEVSGHVESSLDLLLRGQLTPIAELNLLRGVLEGEIGGHLELELRADLALTGTAGHRLDLAGTRIDVRLDRMALALDDRRVTLPAATHLAGSLICGAPSASGPGPFALDLQWDLHGEPCLLHHGELAVSLLSPQLRRGNLVLHLDHQGKLSFSGQKEGFYGVRYFNALLNPASDPGYLQELLRSDDAVAHVAAAVEAFKPELATLLTDLQALWRAGATILAREGIRQPADFIPRAAMTRVFSRLLTGDDRLQDRLIPIVRGATLGDGLDLRATRELLQQELGEFDIDYELSFLVHWLDLVLRPAELLEPARRVGASPGRQLPLDLDPAHLDPELPTAAEIYAAVGQGVDAHWARRLAELAPRLTRRQLGHVLQRVGWPEAELARLRYVHDLKQRIEPIAQGYGGVEYALQPLYVAAFLGEAVGPLPGINVAQASVDAWPPPCALGPEDVARLLQAGLAWGRQDAQTQLNNRLLLELLRREPPALTLQVLIEMGGQSPRALTGVLYALIAQDQDQMAQPLDLVALLEQKLDLPVPRQVDFMAGGRQARASYYEALSRLADAIIDRAGPYLAGKLRLQSVRHAVAPELCIVPALEQLEQRACEAVARADELAAQCRFDGGRGGPRQRSRQAYGRAFRACAELLRCERRAFQLPWFKDFWLRNEEALKVLSVVRGHQEDRDDDRRWLAVQSGVERFDDEQELLRTVVQVLYHRPEHARAMLADPLVRLLIDPDPGQYDFAIIGCMGVITEGKDGAELEHAYERLERERGVRVIRAHTGTARTLEYNARRIIESIESCETPYGLIGYSQGCANALMAESLLLGGAPEERALLSRLVCRNLLFSSANGSAHGTCGMAKFERAMVLGERYLKHYQAVMSREAVESVLSALKGVLDSSVFIAVLGGAHSLTYERAAVLHRDGQFLDHVPTSYTRGVSAAQIVPETLEYLYHMLRVQTGRDDQDTQVLITDAVGCATRVANDHTEVLKRCDMGSLPQATHHWAPLTREIEMVTTRQDLERAVYMSPKDRLVRPWVEVNARFGLIKII